MTLPPKGIKIIQYADDVSIYASGTDIKLISQQITIFVKSIIDYLEERDLEVSPESTRSLFLPQTTISTKSILKSSLRIS